MSARAAESLDLAIWHSSERDRRHLPWRAEGEPFARQCLVEGLLAQTQAEAVAAEYARIFDGIEYAADWLQLSTDEQYARVSPLGLGRNKAGAVTAIAQAIANGAYAGGDWLRQQLGIGPYIAAMVDLLHDQVAIPIDANVIRVASRMGADPIAWMGAIVRAAGGVGGYHVACAVFDVGALLCRARSVCCEGCPLDRHCSYPRKQHQMMLIQ